MNRIHIQRGLADVTDEEVRRLCDFVYRKTGMMFAEEKRYYINRRLAERMLATESTSFQVYFATLRQQTYALDALTGKLLWTFPDGKYSPVVADSKRVYLVGYARIYGLVEGRRLPSNKVPRRR